MPFGVTCCSNFLLKSSFFTSRLYHVFLMRIQYYVFMSNSCTLGKIIQQRVTLNSIKLQMKRLSLKSNWLKFKTSGKVLIGLEEFTEYIPQFNTEKLKDINMKPVGLGNTRISTNLPGHCKESQRLAKQLFRNSSFIRTWNPWLRINCQASQPTSHIFAHVFKMMDHTPHIT